MRTENTVNSSLVLIKVLFLSLLLLFTATLFANNDGKAKDMDMIDFTAAIIGESVSLEWTSFSIAKAFEIQIATTTDQFGELVFTTIGTIEYNSQNNYEFVDDTKKEKGIRYYRIKQQGFNNIEKYSDIKTTNFTNKHNFTMNVFPNSVFTSIDLQINAVNVGNASLEIKNLNVNYTLFQELSIKRGFNEIEIALEDAPAGMYMLMFKMNGDNQTMVLNKENLSDFMVTFE